MIPIAEQERLLQKRAKRELEKQGYKLLANKAGGCQVQSAFTGEIIAGPEFELSIYETGRLFELWGYSTERNTEQDLTAAEMARRNMIYRHSRVKDERDPITGLYTPEYCAAREQMGAN